MLVFMCMVLSVLGEVLFYVIEFVDIILKGWNLVEEVFFNGMWKSL